MFSELSGDGGKSKVRDHMTYSSSLRPTMTATSSSSRKALHNKTNVQSDGTLNSFFARNKRLPEDSSPEGSRKRVRLSEVEHDNGTDSDASDKSDVELEDAQPLQPPRISVFRMMTDMHRNRPNACYPQIICEQARVAGRYNSLTDPACSTHSTHLTIFCIGEQSRHV